MPDMTLTRTGVPSLRLNTPKNLKNAPSYDATAWMRSEPIIHTAPDVTSAPMKQSVMTMSSACAAPPYTPWNVSVTASMKPPIDVTLLRGQHEQDAEDRNDVHQDAGDPAAQHRQRNVLLRVLHLLGRAVLQLETDVVEEEDRHEPEEDRARRAELTRLEARDAVLDAVDDHREREEAEHDEAQDRAEVRDPLAVAQRDDRDADRDPDEDQLEDVVADRGGADLEDVRAPRVVAMNASEPPTQSGFVTQ